MRRHVSAMRGRGAGKKHSRTRRLATWAKAGGSPPPPTHPPTHPPTLLASAQVKTLFSGFCKNSLAEMQVSAGEV